MNKLLLLSLASLFVASSALAEYIVVLKDGKRMVAKQKWTVSGGKAIIELENGQRIQIDPALIDARASEAATKSGLGDAKVLAVQPAASASPEKPKSSLGSLATIRKPATKPEETAQQTATDAPPVASGSIEPDVASKFSAAYENVALYDAKLTPQEGGRLRIDLTADNEDQVFKALSATSFIFANVPSSVTMVELFMRTTNGGSSGRFQMTKEDAIALANKKIEWSDYYVRRVIF